jgi:hypothetical protein
LDGAHKTHEVKMGDRITLSTGGPELRLYTSRWFRRNHADTWPSRPMWDEPARAAQAQGDRPPGGNGGGAGGGGGVGGVGGVGAWAGAGGGRTVGLENVPPRLY